MTNITAQFLIGAGSMIASLTALVGFAVATRNRSSVVAMVGVTAIPAVLSLVAVFLFPSARVIISWGAVGALVFFPLYALYHTLSDFIETTLQDDEGVI